MTEQSFLLHQKIRDFDEFCENALNWDLDYRQLAPGCFNSELLMLGNESTLFTHAKLERRLLHKGTAPPRLVTFDVPADQGISIYWRDTGISGNKPYVFPPGDELYSISQADFDVLVISLSESKLDQLCSSFALPEFRKMIDAHEVFECAPERLAIFRSRLLQLEQEITDLFEAINRKWYLQQLENELADHLIRLLAGCNQPLGKAQLHRAISR